MIMVEIGPIFDDDKLVEDAIGEFMNKIRKIDDYDLIVDENNIEYNHEFIGGDKDDAVSYPGVYIKIPINVK
jgi:hypothetical protein